MGGQISPDVPPRPSAAGTDGLAPSAPSTPVGRAGRPSVRSREPRASSVRPRAPSRRAADAASTTAKLQSRHGSDSGRERCQARLSVVLPAVCG